MGEHSCSPISNFKPQCQSCVGMFSLIGHCRQARFVTFPSVNLCPHHYSSCLPAWSPALGRGQSPHFLFLEKPEVPWFSGSCLVEELIGRHKVGEVPSLQTPLEMIHFGHCHFSFVPRSYSMFGEEEVKWILHWKRHWCQEQTGQGRGAAGRGRWSPEQIHFLHSEYIFAKSVLLLQTGSPLRG